MSNSDTFIEHVRSKVIDRIIFVNDADQREVGIQFQDKTAFCIRLNVRLEVEAIELRYWREGEGTLIQKFL